MQIKWKDLRNSGDKIHTKCLDWLIEEILVLSNEIQFLPYFQLENDPSSFYLNLSLLYSWS